MPNTNQNQPTKSLSIHKGGVALFFLHILALFPLHDLQKERRGFLRLPGIQFTLIHHQRYGNEYRGEEEEQHQTPTKKNNEEEKNLPSYKPTPSAMRGRGCEFQPMRNGRVSQCGTCVCVPTPSPLLACACFVVTMKIPVSHFMHAIDALKPFSNALCTKTDRVSKLPPLLSIPWGLGLAFPHYKWYIDMYRIGVANITSWRQGKQ